MLTAKLVTPGLSITLKYKVTHSNSCSNDIFETFLTSLSAYWIYEDEEIGQGTKKRNKAPKSP